MWEQGLPPDDDPLRQGDLLESVWFPNMRLPLQRVKLGGEGVLLSAKSSWALVMSQCCDNEKGQPVALAPVSRQSNLTADQELALSNPEPFVGTDYSFQYFRLEAPDGIAALTPGPGQAIVVDLKKTALFPAESGELLTLRRRRMTPVARRLLRIKLMASWGRAEESDAEVLEGLNLPLGFSA